MQGGHIFVHSCRLPWLCTSDSRHCAESPVRSVQASAMLALLEGSFQQAAQDAESLLQVMLCLTASRPHLPLLHLALAAAAGLVTSYASHALLLEQAGCLCAGRHDALCALLLQSSPFDACRQPRVRRQTLLPRWQLRPAAAWAKQRKRSSFSSISCQRM